MTDETLIILAHKALWAVFWFSLFSGFRGLVKMNGKAANEGTTPHSE